MFSANSFKLVNLTKSNLIRSYIALKETWALSSAFVRVSCSFKSEPHCRFAKS